MAQLRVENLDLTTFRLTPIILNHLYRGSHLFTIPCLHMCHNYNVGLEPLTSQTVAERSATGLPQLANVIIV
jgi:hypothetical protein